MEGMGMEQKGSCEHGQCHSCSDCKCMHHKIVPATVLIIAILFLLQALGVISMATVGILWPILAGAAAVMKMYAGNCKCYKKM